MRSDREDPEVTETVTVREDDLRLLMEYAGMDIPVEDGEHQVNIVLARCAEALDKDGSEEESGTAPGPDLPPGRYARVEIPGFRQNTGWVTEETRFGVRCAVVRDWSGVVEAEVVIGPGSRVVYLPTPLRRPEAPPAIGARPDDAWLAGDVVADDHINGEEGDEYGGEPF